MNQEDTKARKIMSLTAVMLSFAIRRPFDSPPPAYYYNLIGATSVLNQAHGRQ
jgi:hypothetical protein